MTPLTLTHDLAQKARLVGLLYLIIIVTGLGAELGEAGSKNPRHFVLSERNQGIRAAVWRGLISSEALRSRRSAKAVAASDHDEAGT